MINYLPKWQINFLIVCTIGWLGQLPIYAQPRNGRFNGSTAISSAQAAECQKMMENYLKEMQQYTAPASNRWYYMHLLINTVPKPGTPFVKASLDSRNIEVKVTASKNRMSYESTYLAVYQDETDVFTVIHPRKAIVWSKPNPDMSQGKEAMAQNLVLGQQKLMRSCTVGQCRDTTYEGKPTKIIEMLPAAEAKKEYHIERLVYYYTPSENRMRKQEIDFTADYKIDRQVITYYAIDLNYRSKLPKSAYAEIFDGGTKHQKLRTIYRQYQVEKQ